MNRLNGITVVSASVFALLTLLYTLALPPRQTADVVGLVAAAGTHFAVTMLLLGMKRGAQGAFATVGIGVTATLYWLAGEGTALFWRLLSLSSVKALVLLELAYAIVAALLVFLYTAGSHTGKGDMQ